MNLAKIRILAWAPTLVVLAAAGCRNDNPAGSGPSPGAPSTTPAPGETPAKDTATPMVAKTETTTSRLTPAPAATPEGTTSGLNHSPPAELPAPLTDGQIAAITENMNSGEIEQAKVAKTKSKNQAVLAFANMLIEQHGQAKKRQTALKTTAEQSPLSTELSGEAAQTLAKLNQASGADFDRAYLDAQVDGHQAALDTLKAKLLPAAKSPELTKYLRELQPKIEQHLMRARALRDTIARDAPSGPPSTTKRASVKADPTSASPAPKPQKH